MVNSSKGKREVLVLVEHCRKLETPTTSKTSDAEFENEVDAWAETNVHASERAGGVSAGLERVFIREV